MRRTLCAVALLAMTLGASQAQGQWEEQFDSYSNGKLANQSLWEQWSGSTGVDADVVADPSLTPGKSVKITGQPPIGANGNDVVYDFSNLAGGQPTNGTYILTASTLVPTGATGVGWIIMLNQYPNPMNWSLQQNFDASLGQFIPNEPAGTSTPLLFDTWVPVISCIDLTNDRLDIFYGKELCVENGLWKGNGLLQLACLDLYGGEPSPSNGISEMYFDNIRLEKTGPGMGLVSSPSPVSDGGPVTIDLEAPQAKNGRGFLYIWSVNGTPFRSRLLNVSLDAGGEWSFAGNMPTGISGLQIGMKAFAIPQGGGKINESNIDLIAVQ